MEVLPPRRAAHWRGQRDAGLVILSRALPYRSSRGTTGNFLKASALEKPKTAYSLRTVGCLKVAGPTRLELATSGVTGRRSNQLNYDPAVVL